MAAAPVLTPDTILHELAELWVTLGHQGHAESGTGVLRACSMTLVVLCEEGDDSQALGETLAALMPEHPARVIVLRLHAGANPELAGRVFAQCWMPFGQRRQICCEQVEITASLHAFEDALSLVEAVAAPDLPVVAWCRSFRLLERPEFVKLPALAARVVVDSAGAPDPPAAIQILAGLSARGVAVSDLSWTRLTRWREMLAHAFENRGLPAVVAVRLGFGGTPAPVQARYMAAWIADSLRTAGVTVSVTLEAMPSAIAGDLVRVELTGDGLHLELARRDAGLHIEMDGLARCANLPPATDYSLMREELAIERADRVFGRTLAAARLL